MKKLLFMAAGYAAFVACDGTGNGNGDSGTDSGGDSGGDTTPDGAVLIDSVNHDVGDSSSSYTVLATGITSGGLLYITQDTGSPWEESHDLTGSDGVNLSTGTLTRVETPSAQENNSSTLFNSGMESLMGWKATIYAADNTSEATDCVVWTGSETDSASLFGDNFGGCADANSW